jgi:hypothetical protein
LIPHTSPAARSSKGSAPSRSPGHALLELRDVALDEFWDERDGIAIDPERASVTQGSAEHQQDLAQSRAGLRLTHVSPQEGGELVALVRFPSGIREVGEERPGLLDGQAERPAVVDPGLEATEESQAQPCHRECQRFTLAQRSGAGTRPRAGPWAAAQRDFSRSRPRRLQ